MDSLSRSSPLFAVKLGQVVHLLSQCVVLFKQLGVGDYVAEHGLALFYFLRVKKNVLRDVGDRKTQGFNLKAGDAIVSFS